MRLGWGTMWMGGNMGTLLLGMWMVGFGLVNIDVGAWESVQHGTDEGVGWLPTATDNPHIFGELATSRNNEICGMGAPNMQANCSPLWTRVYPANQKFNLELMPFGWAPANRVTTPSQGEGGHKARACDLATPSNLIKFGNFFFNPDRQLLPAPPNFQNITLAFLKATCPQIPYWVHFTLQDQNSLNMFTSP